MTDVIFLDELSKICLDVFVNFAVKIFFQIFILIICNGKKIEMLNITDFLHHTVYFNVVKICC